MLRKLEVLLKYEGTNVEDGELEALVTWAAGPPVVVAAFDDPVLVLDGVLDGADDVIAIFISIHIFSLIESTYRW